MKTDRTPTLIVDRVSRSFGSLRALKNVSFTAQKGRILGLLGPNGAGKTTLMSVIAGAILPDEGRVAINGIWSNESDARWRRHVAFVPEESPPFSYLTPREYLCFIGGVMNLRGKVLDSRMSRAIETCEISAVVDRDYESLSKGYRRRVILAGSLVTGATVVLLDEPTSGLDPKQKASFAALVRRLSEDAAVVFSSHSLPEVETLCSDLLVLADGSVVASGSTTDLLGPEVQILRMVVDLSETSAVEEQVLLRAPARVKSIHVHEDGQIIDFALDDRGSRQQLLSWAVSEGIPIASLTTPRRSVQDLYEITTGGSDVSGGGSEV
ncbi:MAG: ABC transporter ATP-binding protein [Spirochaetota bacterium]